MPSLANSDGNTRRTSIITLTAMAAVLCYFFFPHQLGDMQVTELQRRMIAIFIVAAVFWATEVLPLFATSLLVIGMEIIFLADIGGLARVLPSVGEIPEDEHLKYTVFLSSFGSHIIILFMGGFLLSAALTKHGIDRVIAAIFLQPFTKNPTMLIFGVIGITAFFSMWMSNTATAAMMLAIVAPIVRQLPKEDVFHRGVILAVPFGANIGGIGTPIGTPPNAVAFDALNAPGSGFSVTFLDWVIMAVPLELMMLVVVGFMLLFLFPMKGKLELGKLQKPSKISAQGWVTLIILVAAIALWLTGKWTGLASGAVALMIAASLTAFKILDRSDVDSIDWNVLILMWGGLSLGSAMNKTGLTDMITVIDFTALPGGEWMVAVIVVIVALVFSTFMSNTATANLLIPITMALALSAPESRGELAVLAALGCSFAMAMPVSTPPNAIAFATGKIPVGAMIRSGGMISIIATIVMLLGYKLVLPRLMDFGTAVGQ